MKIYKGIYCIMNTTNGKKYIGSSINIKERWKTHKRLLNKGIHDNNHLQNAWNKYGKDRFIFYIIQEIDVENRIDLFKYEDDYILKFETLNSDKGYNKELNGKKTEQSKNSNFILKPVLLINKSGKITNEFISIAEAARFLECTPGLIDRILNNRITSGRKARTIREFQIIYKEDFDPAIDYVFIKKYRVEVLDENLNSIKMYNNVVDIIKDYNIPISSIYGAIKFGYKCRNMYFKKIDKNGNSSEINVSKKYRSKQIIVITPEGEVYNFNSTADGLKHFNIPYEKLKYVKQCIRKGYKAYGMEWKFKEN